MVLTFKSQHMKISWYDHSAGLLLMVRHRYESWENCKASWDHLSSHFLWNTEIPGDADRRSEGLAKGPTVFPPLREAAALRFLKLIYVLQVFSVV